MSHTEHSFFIGLPNCKGLRPKNWKYEVHAGSDFDLDADSAEDYILYVNGTDAKQVIFSIFFGIFHKNNLFPKLLYIFPIGHHLQCQLLQAQHVQDKERACPGPRHRAGSPP